jgi:hypothetical protein
MNFNQFQASNAALNFAANAQMIDAYAAMAILDLKDLSGFTDKTGKFVEGIFALTGEMAIDDQSAIIDSGLQEQKSQQAQGWSQIAGSIVSGASALAGYKMGQNLESAADLEGAPEQQGRLEASAQAPSVQKQVEIELSEQTGVRAELPQTETKEVSVELDAQKNQAPKDNLSAEESKKAKEDRVGNLYRKANSYRDTSFQLGNMASSLAQGIGGTVGANYTSQKAEADAARTGFDNAIQQLGSTYNLFVGIIQQMGQSMQAARDTQAAIVAVTKS